jgi:hypothetical protein
MGQTRIVALFPLSRSHAVAAAWRLPLDAPAIFGPVADAANLRYASRIGTPRARAAFRPTVDLRVVVP